MKTLALQGGGILGFGQVTALSEFENGKPLSDTFELIGGTSVGCIVGAMIAAGLPMSKVSEFFLKDSPNIFHAPWYSLAISRLYRSAKYDPTVLENSLKELLGTLTLADCKTKFVATAVDMKSGRNVYFQSYGTSSEDSTEVIIGPDSGMKLWEVCRASSAAQTYFPGFVWGKFVFWDGGSTGCNAPDMLVMTEAENYVAISEIQMLSIGAGREDWKFANCDMTNPGIKTVLQATLEIAYACGETNEIWQAKHRLGDRHQRLNAYIGGGFEIDDASADTFAKIQTAWRQEVIKNPKIVLAFRS